MTDHGASEHGLPEHSPADPSPADFDPVWVRRWLAILLAAAALSTVQISLWPRRPEVSPPAPLPGAGQALPSLPGHTGVLTAVSVIQRQRLPDGEELRLAGVVSARGGVNLTGLTAPLPSLNLRDRRLLQRPSGQFARGSLRGHPALQTCLIGSSYAVTVEALNRLAERQQPLAGSRVQRLLGLQPQPDSRCLLVTLLATAATSAGGTTQSDAAQQEALLTHFEAVITRLRASR